MSSSCTHDCSTCGKDCASRKPEDLLIKTNANSNVKKIIGVISGKGGVGKSMVTSLLAVQMRREGFTTAVLDADITGPSIPQAFGIKGQLYGDENNNIWPAETPLGIRVVSTNLILNDPATPVLWRGPVIGGLVKQFYSEVNWGDVDYMFVDMPPGTGDVALTVFQSIPLDGIIIVATPQELVSMIVEKAVRMANQMNVPILGLIENMSYINCDNCGNKVYLFGRGRTAQLASQYGLDLLAEIPIDPELARKVDLGEIETYPVELLKGVAEILEK